MKPFKPRETLTEQVAQHVENLIAFGQIKSGERIYESTMAKQLDVSHGSIREGFLLLEKRHLVKNVPRKGAFVTEIDAYFVRSLYEVVELYLGHNARKLAQNWKQEDIDRLEDLYERMFVCYDKGDVMSFLDLGIQYTRASLAYADNYFILEAIENLWPSSTRCAVIAFQHHANSEMLKHELEFMRESLDAIKAHDEDTLLSILHGYMTQQRDQVLSALGATDDSTDST